MTNEDEPIPDGELHEPPAHLSEREKEVWQQAIENAPRGLLKLLDENQLLYWVEAHCLREKMKQNVIEFGIMIKTPGAETTIVNKDGSTRVVKKGSFPMKSPFQTIMDQQTKLCMQLMSELGFNPTARTRISLSGSGAKASNPFANNAANKKRRA